MICASVAESSTFLCPAGHMQMRPHHSRGFAASRPWAGVHGPSGIKLIRRVSGLRRRVMALLMICLAFQFVYSIFYTSVPQQTITPNAAGVKLATEGTDPVLVFGQFHQASMYAVRSVLHARCSNPSSRITVILHDKELLNIWQRFAVDAHITLHTPSESTRSEMVNFEKIFFRPSSIQPAWRSVYWFTRFITLHNYLVEENIMSLLYLDLDLLLFDDVAQHISPDTAPVKWASFATHWTQRSLAAFKAHLLDFYAQNNTLLAEGMLETGQVTKQFSKVLLTRKDIDAWWPQHLARAEFSDMHLLMHFVKHHPEALDVKCNYPQEAGCPKVYIPLENVRSETGGECGNTTKVKGCFTWRWNDALQIMQPMFPNTQDVVPAMHFQGPECKQTLSDIACPNIRSCRALAHTGVASMACFAESLVSNTT